MPLKGTTSKRPTLRDFGLDSTGTELYRLSTSSRRILFHPSLGWNALSPEMGDWGIEPDSRRVRSCYAHPSETRGSAQVPCRPLSAYGIGSHSAQLSVRVCQWPLNRRNVFATSGILRRPRMGPVKRTLALVLGLAAVLLFAPVARADSHDGKSPYRDVAGLLGHASGMQPADGEQGQGDGDHHDGEANDESHHADGQDASDGHGDSHEHDGNDSSDDHDGDSSGSDGEHDGDSDDGSSDSGSDDNGTAGGDNPGSGNGNGNQPGTNPGTPTGPTTQSVPANSGLWLWVLLVVIAGAAVTTAYVLRRRRMRAR